MYPWLPLRDIKRYEPEMKRLGVSQVARSPRGFLTAYKRWFRLSLDTRTKWIAKRNAFIARHIVQYKQNPTYRRWLALVAWAYKPPIMFPIKK